MSKRDCGTCSGVLCGSGQAKRDNDDNCSLWTTKLTTNAVECGETNPPAGCVGIYSLNGYQKAALRTAGMETQTVKFSNFGLGLSGEAGEVTDYLKKVLYHGYKLDNQKLCKELGDVMWYVATLADTAGLTLEEVARVNIEKLRVRYPDGFSKERSVNREESQ